MPAYMGSELHDVIGAGGSIMNESITKAAGGSSHLSGAIVPKQYASWCSRLTINF